MENYFQRCASLISLQMDFFFFAFFPPFPAHFFSSVPRSLAKSFCLIKIHAFPTNIKPLISSFLFFSLLSLISYFLPLFFFLPVFRRWKKGWRNFSLSSVSFLSTFYCLWHHREFVFDILFACTYLFIYFLDCVSTLTFMILNFQYLTTWSNRFLSRQKRRQKKKWLHCSGYSSVAHTFSINFYVYSIILFLPSHPKQKSANWI